VASIADCPIPPPVYTDPVSRWERAAWEVAGRLPPREGARLLVGSCWHGRGFRWFGELSLALEPDLVVCLGDLSGLGSALEAVVVQSMWDVRAPTVFAPGNHDTEAAKTVMEHKGAVVLRQSVLVEVAGIGVWGYPDPNRTRWGHRDPYDPDLCKAVGGQLELPNGDPYLVAVHSASMVARVPPACSLVLSGHAHVPKVYARPGGVVVARCGTVGGGGLNWPGKATPFQAMIVDLALPGHWPNAVWFVESDGKTAKVERVYEKS
jgi:predicted phosphodiesterase